jgi:hypothetical protein
MEITLASCQCSLSVKSTLGLARSYWCRRYVGAWFAFMLAEAASRWVLLSMITWRSWWLLKLPKGRLVLLGLLSLVVIIPCSRGSLLFRMRWRRYILQTNLVSLLSSETCCHNSTRVGCLVTHCRLISHQHLVTWSCIITLELLMWCHSDLSLVRF